MISIDKNIAVLDHISDMSDEMKQTLLNMFEQEILLFEDVLIKKQRPPFKVSKRAHSFIPNKKTIKNAENVDFGGNDWFSLYYIFENICKKYFLIDDKELKFKSKEDVRFAGGCEILNENITNKFIKCSQIDFRMAYTSKFVDMIMKKEMFFNKRYIEFIYPLIFELSPIFKENNMFYSSTIRGFLNYLFGMLTNKYSGVNSTELENKVVCFYNDVINEIYNTCDNDDLFYTLVDTIYFRKKDETYNKIKKVLDKHNIKFDIIKETSIGYFEAKRKYMIFDKDMNIQKSIRVNLHE